jgi:hypothetical protein
MKKSVLALVVFCSLVFIGCTSVPHAGRATPLQQGEYEVAIARAYTANPEHFRYAVNSFVKSVGGTSYDVEHSWGDKYRVTVPGSTEVLDLPEVKVLHKGKTVAAIVVPSAIGAGIAYIVVFMSLLL